MARWLFPLLTTIIVAILTSFDRASTLELPVRDFAMRLMAGEPARSTIVAAIDERSLKEIGPWPWDRTVLAEIVARAAEAEAKAVVLDIPLAEPRFGDDQLAREMKRIPTIAIPAPAPKLREVVVVASGDFPLDHDGILRRATALSMKAASILDAASVPEGRSVAPAFRTAPRDVPVVSATDVLWHRTPAGDLRGRLLFIGPTVGELRDRVLTPVSLVPDPGVTVHAAAAESLVRRETVREVPPIAAGIVAGLLVGAMMRMRERPRGTRIGVAVLMLFAVAAGGYLLFSMSGVAVPFVILTLTVLLAAVTTVP